MTGTRPMRTFARTVETDSDPNMDTRASTDNSPPSRTDKPNALERDGKNLLNPVANAVMEQFNRFGQRRKSMHTALRRSVAIAGLGALATLATATAASAQGSDPGAVGQRTQQDTVFVQTNSPSGNAIDVFAQHSDGTLSWQGTVPTGGLGGQAAGSVADHLASQHSLTYDHRNRLLFAVNAGSDSLSVLSAQGGDLRLVQVVSSGGDFPDSVTVHGDLVYVLDAGRSGTVTGYRIFGDHLIPLPGSSRTLGLSNTTPPFFLSSPGQIGFSPNGADLIVTTKGSTSSLDVFTVNAAGLPSATPTVTADPGNSPFSFTFSPSGQLVTAEAGHSTVHTYALGSGGSLTSLSASVPDGQAALCWITKDGGYYYVANVGSNNLSAYSVASDGIPSLVGSTGVAATTDAGPIDIGASADTSTLYVEAGAAGAVDEFHVNPDGSLSNIGSVAGLGAGIEGIAIN